MDPKNNANPAADDEQNNPQPIGDMGQNPMPSLGNEAPAIPTPEAGADTSAGATVTPTDPAKVTMPDESMQPADAIGSQTVSLPGDSRPSITGEAPTTTETPGSVVPTGANPPAIPVDQQAQQPMSTDSLHPMAPSSASGDKKTIMVLSVVALVLLIAIAALYFVV